MYGTPALMDAILGYSPLVTDWQFGLWTLNVDPVTDLATSEITRIPMPLMTAGTPSTSSKSISYSNAAEFMMGPLDACTIGGWFLANGATETDILWVATLNTPVTIGQGNYARFPAGVVTFTLANTP